MIFYHDIICDPKLSTSKSWINLESFILRLWTWNCPKVYLKFNINHIHTLKRLAIDLVLNKSNAPVSQDQKHTSVVARFLYRELRGIIKDFVTLPVPGSYWFWTECLNIFFYVLSYDNFENPLFKRPPVCF